MCIGAAISMSDLTSGGFWSSSNTHALAGSSSGIVTGSSSGTSIIFYTLPTGCFVADTVSVISLPSLIGGPGAVCIGSSIVLTDLSAGGTWTSGSTNASVGSFSGTVTGDFAGTAIITYTMPAGCYITSIVTVNPLPLGITGGISVCVGSSTTLSDLSIGGYWSNSGGFATIGSATGLVTGFSSGLAGMTYTLPTGCFATASISVNPLPAAISGSTRLCVGSAVVLTDLGSGIWSSSNSLLATVGSVTGIVNGLASGSPIITYTLPTGCATTFAITVNPLPLVISGLNGICAGSSTIFSDLTTGGLWSSSDNSIATIGSVSGTVSGSTGGTVFIDYTLPTGCYTTKPLTINALPAPITGATSVCIGNSAFLSDVSTGGSWSSSTGHASVGSSSGIVTGISSGTSVITYALPTGCSAITSVTVVSLPSVIAGPSSVCAGNSVTLSDPGGGLWSSSNGNASVGSLSGTLFGVTSGISVITYTLGTGCFVTTSMTVNPAPGSIVGNLDICAGSASALSNSMPGGTWSSSNHSVATIGSVSGIVAALAPGTTVITYLLNTGCSTISVVTVNSLPVAIVGPSFVCLGGNITLTDVSSGTWSSSDISTATIGSSSGIVSGIATGVVMISYSNSLACAATKTITVDPLPSAISGQSDICLGSSATLSSSSSGGRWVSSNALTASVGSVSGVVLGIATGSVAITYSLGTGCFITKLVTIDPLPSPIRGIMTVCPGNSTLLSDTTSGGTWSAGSTSISVGSGTGIVTGLSTGVSSVTYTIGSGCSTTARVTVNPLPVFIAGPSAICIGSSATFGDASAGGSWSSSDPSTATIGSATGLVNAMSIGVAIITYAIPTGCLVTKIVTVNPLPPAISGAGTICPGAEIALNDSVAGGIWTSHDISIVIAGSATGMVTGVGTGTTYVTYTLPTGCIAVTSVTVSPMPAPITGPGSVCVGSSITFSDTAIGGPWSSGSPLVATIAAGSGIITGISTGTAIMSYTVRSTGCIAIKPVIVDPVSPILGITEVCVGNTVTLYDTTLRGAWSSALPAIASVSAGGVVTGVSSGISIITYTLPTGCNAVIPVTVDPLPPVISGPGHLCIGQSGTLTDAVSGGVWNSSNAGIATINPLTGAITAISAGVATMSYSVSGCPRLFSLTVNPLPAPISGSMHVCKGNTIILLDATLGGTWSSSIPLAGSVTVSSGIVTGLSTGTTLIFYTLATGCATEVSVTIDPLPSVITGVNHVCIGSSVSLSDSITGGLWSSSDSITAAINTTGITTGITEGVAIMTYTLGTGCLITSPVTVNSLPAAIEGLTYVCVGRSVILTDSATGGLWSCSGTAGVAVVGSVTGVVTGLASGTVTIDYTSTGTGCITATTITVNPLPLPVSGPSNFCAGLTGIFNDLSLGGRWSSGNTAVATIDSITGVARAVSSGSVLLEYTLATGCAITSLVSVDPMPLPILGRTDICLGTTSVLRDTVRGGIWLSADLSKARVDSFTGAVTGISVGLATIVYTFGSGCTTMTAVNIHSLPQIYNVTGGGSYCEGGSGVAIGLDHSDIGSDYLLYHGATATGTFHGSGSTLDFGLQTMAGAYHAVAINTLTGCSQTMAGIAGIVVTPSVIPSVSIVPSADTVCAGSSVSFTPIAVNGGSSPTYNWIVNGTGVGSGNTYTFIPANGDSVTVTMLSNFHCVTPASANSRSVALTVTPYAHPAVHILATPGDTVCKGAIITLSAVTDYGGYGPVYHWWLNGMPVAVGSGISASAYSYVPDNGDVVDVTMLSNYACRLSDIDSAHLVVTVDTPVMPVVTIVASPGTVVQPGESVTFTASSVGAIDPAYQWYRNGYPISGATTDTYTGSNFNRDKDDSLSCLVTSNGLCRITSFAWVYVTVSTVSVPHISSSYGDINVLPNPNNGAFTVRGAMHQPGADETVLIEIADVVGRIVYKDEIVTKNGKIDKGIDLGDAGNGMYLMTLHSATLNKVFHVVLER